MAGASIATARVATTIQRLRRPFRSIVVAGLAPAMLACPRHALCPSRQTLRGVYPERSEGLRVTIDMTVILSAAKDQVVIVVLFLHRGGSMTNQRHPVHLSIASSSEIEQTARQLKAIREEFLTTGILSQHPPRPMILESWRRCHAMQVNPSLRYAPLAVTHEVQLCHLREASQLVMRAARPVMSHLADFLADSGYVIVLSDADGCLLEVIGDAGVRRRLASIDFVPGGDWSESAAGTNALGTAIADGHVVQLLGAEHYCSGWQDLTCTAAPIRHPLSSEIMGILDVTGNYRLIRPFLSSFIAAMALQVQQEMRKLLTPTRKGNCLLKAQLLTNNGGGSSRRNSKLSLSVLLGEPVPVHSP